jgi:S1-C subfamily serine protease
VHVAPGSQAEEAGIEVGTVIESIGVEVTTAQNWARLVDDGFEGPAGSRLIFRDASGEVWKLSLRDYY